MRPFAFRAPDGTELVSFAPGGVVKVRGVAEPDGRRVVVALREWATHALNVKSEGPLRFTTSGEVALEVTEAGDIMLFGRLVERDEKLRASMWMVLALAERKGEAR